MHFRGLQHMTTPNELMIAFLFIPRSALSAIPGGRIDTTSTVLVIRTVCQCGVPAVLCIIHEKLSSANILHLWCSARSMLFDAFAPTSITVTATLGGKNSEVFIYRLKHQCNVIWPRSSRREDAVGVSTKAFRIITRRDRTGGKAC
ncbi:hypothetical protein CPB85DRAFT_480390 [Mucidula mucida]|nr:hypothetical protein CPB85DRAFT_480390 [Mucidula mucida]